MANKNRTPLAGRVAKAAETALAAQKYVSPIDVLVGIGWLDPGAPDHWRRAQLDCLEEAVQTRPDRQSEFMTLLHARTPQRQTLRFSESGDPSIEQFYRTQWVSPDLSEKKRERLAEKTSRAPDLVVIRPLNTQWKCHRCGATGDLLIMENPGPACLRCVGLDDLDFLSAGDTLLTRRVKAKSARCAVVMRFSRSRRRYERQGLLVEPRVLADVSRDLEKHRPG